MFFIGIKKKKFTLNLRKICTSINEANNFTKLYTYF